MTNSSLSEEKLFENTKKQGDAGLGIAIGWFATKGYTVSVPLTDSQDYDLVVEIDSVLYKVQVRMTIYKRFKNYLVNLSVKGGNRSGINKLKVFDNSKVDLLFIATGEGTNYLIPTSELKLKHQMSLNKLFDKYIILRRPTG